MNQIPTPDPSDFGAVVASLNRGDFTALDPLFASDPVASPALAVWVREGRFASEKSALNEALTCASFNGRVAWIPFLLEHGADPAAGWSTGMDALQWAANRGQVDAVRILLGLAVPLETRNRFGGTVLGATVWASANEPRPTHPAIIELLLKAGADIRQAQYPSGVAAVDAVLEATAPGPELSCRLSTSAPRT